MPYARRLGAGLGGLGALIVAPYLAGTCILVVLGLPMDQLRFGLAYDYWKALDLPAFAPYAARIRWAASLGCALAPAVWAGCVARAWRQARLLGPPPRHPYFLWPWELPRDGKWSQARQPVLTRHRLRRYRLPVGESLLLAAPTYPATQGVLKGAVRDANEPLLVIDLNSGMHGATAGWCAQRGDVVHLAPFGGGVSWNPLAVAWTPEGLLRQPLDELAACWYPEQDRKDRALTSHVRGVFRTLVTVMDDVLRAGGDVVPPAPGDLSRLLALSEGRLDRRVLVALARKPALSAATRDALLACAGLDDATRERIAARLRVPLHTFAGADIDAGTRGRGQSLAPLGSSTTYVDIPLNRRHEAVPVIEAFVAQWLDTVRHDDALIVIHGLDLLPPLLFLQRRFGGFRCMASVTSLAALHDNDSYAGRAHMHRFGVLAVHAPREAVLAAREAAAIAAHVAHRCGPGRPIYANAPHADALMALRAGEQVVFASSLSHAVRCRVVAPSDRAPPLPVSAQGGPMPFPKPLAVLLASLVAGCSPPSQKVMTVPPTSSDCNEGNFDDDPEGTEVVCLGPHRFRLLSKLFNAQYQPSASNTEFGFVLDWPTLEPLPYGFDMYKDNNRFLAVLRIRVSYLDRLSDEQYRIFSRRWIEPYDPSDPEELKRPDDNLHLRIKGAPVYGLTPYYADFDKLKAYYVTIYGPKTRAFEPDGNDDWYLDMGENDIPRTVLACSPEAIPAGVRMQNGRMVEIDEVFRRAGCRHRFVIPEYRAYVDLSYQRLVMSDWQRIETRIRSLLHDAEIDR